MNSRRRYVVAGTGHRSRMYLDALAGPHRADADLVGLVEPNPGRLAVQQKRLAAAGLDPDAMLTGGPDDLEEVITKAGADRLIVTSPDYTHAELIVRGLTAGVDVVVEKPLTIDPPSTRQIAEAAQQTGRHVVVTHNYRYSPRNSGLKQIVKSGAIGDPAVGRPSSGCSTPRTARTTSAAGTGRRPTPVVCSSTRPRTTSTW